MRKTALAVALMLLSSSAMPQTTPTTHSVKLTWLQGTPTTTPPPPPSPTPITYNVYKYGGMPGNVDPPVCSSTPISQFVKIAANITVTTWTDGPGIPNGVTRCYYVTEVDGTGVESDPSPILSVLVVLPVPTKPVPPTNFVGVVI